MVTKRADNGMLYKEPPPQNSSRWTSDMGRLCRCVWPPENSPERPEPTIPAAATAGKTAGYCRDDEASGNAASPDTTSAATTAGKTSPLATAAPNGRQAMTATPLRVRVS